MQWSLGFPTPTLEPWMCRLKGSEKAPLPRDPGRERVTEGKEG